MKAAQAKLAEQMKAAQAKAADDLAEAKANVPHGLVNPKLVCPHCGFIGRVHTKAVKEKVGISGGKAVAGLLTGGCSLLAVGLSRRQQRTEAWCRNCTLPWRF